MHFRKASPFGLVSMYRKNRDRHCAYRPVASIDFGYLSNNDKILNESLLVLKKVEGYMVRYEVKDLWPQLLVGDLCQADLIGDDFHSGFELSFVKVKSRRQSHLRWEK
ncbi:hypothetical protein Tco_1158887 [Tanacetum coccineum]